MKVAVTFVVVSCCVLGLFCGQSEALKCYECTTTASIDCGDPFKNATIVDNCNVCAKGKGHLGSVKGISRGCYGPEDGFSEGCRSESDEKDSGEMCYCKSDLCNASTRVAMATTLLVLLPALLLGFKTV
ncbi:protein quiver-like [Mya arenaria]|uniref:protein quiver-like n=1 Tax=Mya arenaria TaxID=6604 RepID=UPI0022E79C52|nr:protein quiver-like [Mya arenaria]